MPYIFVSIHSYFTVAIRFWGRYCFYFASIQVKDLKGYKVSHSICIFFVVVLFEMWKLFWLKTKISMKRTKFAKRSCIMSCFQWTCVLRIISCHTYSIGNYYSPIYLILSFPYLFLKHSFLVDACRCRIM